MEAAPQPVKPATPFNFGSMANMKASSDQERPVDNTPPPEEVVAAPVNPVADTSATVKPDEDEDLVIGAQLDEISPKDDSVQPAAVEATSSTTAEPSVEPTPAGNEQTAPAQSSEATLQNPDDPRLASLLAGGRQEAQERMQERAAANPSGGRGAGGPGLGAALGAGIAGGFKLMGNGLKSVRGHDPSLPKRMTVAEKRATRDPVSAQKYYDNAGDGVLREAIYRDSFNGMNSLLAEARSAERNYQDGVKEMGDFFRSSPLQAMADKAQTSIGDYVNGLNSGTIKDAAALTIVQNLQQDNKFKSAENKIVSSAKTVMDKSEAALKKMNNIDVSFPNRLDTTMRKQQVSDMMDGMQNDEISKLSIKAKETLDELQRLSDMIKKIIVDFVQKVGSVFQSAQPKP